MKKAGWEAGFLVSGGITLLLDASGQRARRTAYFAAAVM
jgi:hypothetical protein